MKKALFALIIFLIAFAIPMAIYSYYFAEPDSSTNENENVTGGTVNSDNRAPVIHSIPAESVVQNTEYVYRVKATDQDGDTIEYRLQRKPTWLSWDENLVTLRGTPTSEQVGAHTVEILVTDGEKVKSQKFTIEVISENTDETQNRSEDTIEGSSVDDEFSSDGSAEGVEGVASDLSGTLPEPELEELTDHGLYSGSENRRDGIYNSPPQSANDSESGQVLGTVTQLPNTALFGGSFVLVIAVGVILMALFLWADARWHFLGDWGSLIKLGRGKEITLEVEPGIVIKKKERHL